MSKTSTKSTENETANKADLRNLNINGTYTFQQLEHINNYAKDNPIEAEGQLISHFDLVNQKLVPVPQVPIAFEAFVTEISRQLGNWNIYTGQNGIITTPQGGFNFDVSGRQQKIWAPSVAFTPKEICDSLNKDQFWSFQSKAFTPIFIVEVANIPSEIQFKNLDGKFINDYFATGTSVKLGWLIDPKNKRIWIYEFGKDNRVCCNNHEWKDLSGGDILQGFTLDLSKIEDIIPQVSESEDEESEKEDEEEEEEEEEEEGTPCTYCGDKIPGSSHDMINHIEKSHIRF